jgi:CheY-like chemotaxis protein
MIDENMIDEKKLEERLVALEAAKSWSPRVVSRLEMLLRSGTDEARSGRFAMEFAQSATAALDRIAAAADRALILILSDINMPGMSGLELLPRAKNLRPDVPIVMITAYGDAETKRKALEQGAEALLTKPIDFGSLRSEIDQRVGSAA